MKYLPNIISILRIVLIVPTINFLWHHEFSKTLVLFFVAGASDALDGFLARRFGWQTRLGSLLDPLADKLLMTAIYLTLGLQAYLPMWLMLMVIGRDAIIVLGALAYRLLIKEIRMKHLMISKLNTAMQILLVLLLIFRLSGLPLADQVPMAMVEALVYAVAFTTLISGLAYVYIWSARARREFKVRIS